jgi:hypothetical protein
LLRETGLIQLAAVVARRARVVFIRAADLDDIAFVFRRIILLRLHKGADAEQ